MAKKTIGRMAAETSEGLKTNTVDAPESRFQDQQQVNPAVESGDNSVTTTGFTPKKNKAEGHELRQEVASRVLSSTGAPGAPAGSASPAAFGLKQTAFSGDFGTIVGSAAGTPRVGERFDGKTRMDKRLSDANKDINYNASEVVITEYDNIPALADSESTVGYNGNAKNVMARAQKRSGHTPAEMLYDRSLDFIARDEAVFVTGQVVQTYADLVGESYPTRTIEYNVDSPDYGKERDFKSGEEKVRGNFMPEFIRVTFGDVKGKKMVTSFEVIETDLSANDESGIVVDSASTNHKIDLNRAELSRQTIDADAGSPTSEHFNPLGRSVSQPTATLTMLQDIENATGATMYAAYKFANKARGHYLNRTAKDGQDNIGPALDALYGHLFKADDLASLQAAIPDIQDDKPLMSKVGNARGSAFSLINAFDSATKYKTKADLVNQPRGLKMHIQTADNNINPFRCKSEFIAALNSVDAYSTIGHGYDPSAPVCITDNVRLIYPYSWRRMLRYTRDVSTGVKTFQSDVFAYSYYAGAGMNSYIVAAADPILNGVSYFLDLHATAIANAIDGDELVIPIQHSTMHFSLWDLLLCAASPYIVYERTNTMKDILDYEMFYKYPLQGNVLIKDAQPTSAVNYANPSTLEPLQVKQMLPSSAMSWIYPEVLMRVGSDYILPFYFNERSFEWGQTGKNSTIIPNGSAQFTTPVIRSGVRLGALDDFFSMEVKDQLLIQDPMVRVPGFADTTSAIPAYVYKYSLDSDGQVILRSSALTGDITAANYYATPRLLGWYCTLPYGSCINRTSGSKHATLEDIAMRDMRPSYRAIMYKALKSGYTTDPTSILSPGSINISRGQAFTQQWYMAHAGDQTDRSAGFDLILSFGDGFVNLIDDGKQKQVSVIGSTTFSPFMFGPATIASGVATNACDNVYGESENDKPAVLSIHHVLWTIIQKLPFAINPFDYSPDSEAPVDPWSLGYLFGLSGFIAADYNEELYNRVNEVQQQGFGYTHDAMVSASPIFKDSFKYTVIG